MGANADRNTAITGDVMRTNARPRARWLIRARAVVVMAVLVLVVVTLASALTGEARAQGASDAQERQERQTRFRDLDDREALRLARQEFAEKVAAPSWGSLEHGRWGRVKRYLGDARALVELPGGKHSAIVQSTLPLRARDASGELAPLDLDLVERLGALEPDNALVQTRIGRRAGDGLRFEGGVGVDFPGVARDASAQVQGDKAFYAEALPSSDQIVAANPQGVEVMWQLRSRESPEELPLDFELPAGARLRAVRSREGVTRIEVMRGDERLMTVLPPAVRDAEGKSVPAEYRLEGRRLTLVVAHRDRDVLYPLLADPTIIGENWVNRNGDYSINWRTDPNLDFDGWRPFTVWGSPGYQYNSGFGRGLWVGLNEWGTGHGEWRWQAPGNARLVRAEFGSYKTYGSGGCVQEGIKRADGSWDNTTNGGPWGPSSPSTHPCDGPPGYQIYCTNPCGYGGETATGSTPGSMAIFGVWRNPGQSTRWDGYISGAALALTDLDRPYWKQAEASENLLDGANWSFEGCADQWQVSWADGGCSHNSLQVHGGTHFSIRRRAGEGVSGYALGDSKRVPAVPGRTYATSYFARPEAGMGQALARSELWFFDANGNAVGSAFGGWAREAPAWNWARTPTVTATAPAGTTTVMLRMAWGEARDWEWHNADAALLEERCEGGCAARWTRKATRQITLVAQDDGVGANRIRVSTPTSGGTNQIDARQHPCAGNRHDWCPASHNREGAGYGQAFTYDTDSMPEGINRIGTVGADVTENATPGSWDINSFDTNLIPPARVDRTAPKLDLSNGAVRPGATLGAGQHELRVEANDVGAGGATNSGVKRIEYSLDGAPTTAVDKACASGPCSQRWVIDTTETGLSEGRHRISVKATDGVNLVGEQSFAFVVDRSAPERPVLSGPVHDDQFFREQAYGLHVEARDGVASPGTDADVRAGVKSAVLYVGRDAQTGAWKERARQDQASCAQDNCALQADLVFDVAQAAVSEGRQDVKLRLEDFAGNAREVTARKRPGDLVETPWSVVVDRGAPAFSLGGSLKTVQGTTLYTGAYTLNVDDRDGELTPREAERSGVTETRVYVDGNPDDADPGVEQKPGEATRPCPTGSCAMKRAYAFVADDWGPGDYVVRVRVRDQLGHEAPEQTVKVRVGALIPEVSDKTARVSGFSGVEGAAVMAGAGSVGDVGSGP